jgi:Lhr-like helicase
MNLILQRRSERIMLNRKEENQKIFNELVKYMKCMHNPKQNVIEKINTLIDIYKHFKNNYDAIYEHFCGVKKDDRFIRILYTMTINQKGRDLEREIEDFIIKKKFKVKTKLNVFRKLYTFLDKKNMDFLDKRIKALCSRVRLNDDVFRLIFSYF